MKPEEGGSYQLGDFYNLVDTVSKEGYYDDRIKSRYYSAASSLASQQASQGNFLNFFNDIDKALYDMINTGRDEAPTEGTELATKVINSMVRGMDNYLMGDDYNIGGVREVIKDLTGWSARGAEYDVDEKDKFLKKKALERDALQSD